MILPSDFIIQKYGLYARFVEENDAEFIVKLRTDPLLSRYLHAISNDVGEQKDWIWDYKKRERRGEDYYFIFFKEGIPIGLNRVYNIHGTTFTTGSWVFSHEAPFECSIAASIMIRELCFEQMGFELEDAYDGVHVDNKQVYKFNKLIGLKETRRYMTEDGEFISMQMTKVDFERNKPKLLKYLGF